MKLKSMMAVGVLSAACLIPLGAASASATVDSFGVCVPSDETTETITHPAVGEPTITVPNPEYVPAVPEVPGVPAVGTPTIIVDNPDYVPAIPGTPGSPAIGEPTIEIENPDYVPAVPGTPGQPAVGEPTIVVPNPDYKPAIPEESHVVHHPAITHEVYHPAVYETVVITPAVEYKPAVYETLYEFRHKLLSWKTHWSTNPNWNAEQNDHSLGWYATGRTKQGDLISPEVPAQDAVTEERLVTAEWTETVIDQEAYDETVIDVIGQPAVGEPTLTIPNPDHVPAVPEVPGTPAIGEPTLVVPNPEYVPAVPATEEVPAIGEPTIEVANPEYVPAIPAIPGTPAVGTETIITVNPDYQPEWVETITIPAVECPVDPGEKPADFTLPSEWFVGTYDCDDTTVTETRVVDTYTYKLVDGQWVETFVKQDTETRERDLTAEEIEALECEVPTEPKPEEPKPEEPKAEEPKAEAPKPAVKAAAKVQATDDSTLAVTGGEVSPWLLGGGLLAMLAGAGALVARRKH